MSKIDIPNIKNRFIIPISIIEIDENKNLKIIKKCNGLIDTGATHSTISKKIVKELNLKSYSETEVRTASGNMRAGIYFLKIGIEQILSPIIDIKTSQLLQPKELPIFEIKATEFIGDEEIDMLIGMDILLRSTIIINNGILSLIIH